MLDVYKSSKVNVREVDWLNFASTSFTGGGCLISDKCMFSTSFFLNVKEFK